MKAKRFLVVLLSVLLLFLLITTTIIAQNPGALILENLFKADKSEVADFFDQSFLSQVPADKIVEILDLYTDKLGQLEKISGSNGKYTMVFAKGTAPAQVVLNSDNKMTGLWFGNWTISDDSGAGIISEFKAMEGSVAVSVIKNNREVILSHNHDKKMAVGSAFKLYVLKAVYSAVEKGDLAWDSIVELQNDDKTLPSGILQNWPEGTPLTIKTLTNLVISISDNTATDILIDTIGRQKVEKFVDETNIPFLKTSELFKLKYAVEQTTQARYINSDQQTRRKILDDISDKTVDISMFDGSPKLIEELEWFFTTEELCRVIYDLQEAEELGINPGLVSKDDWYLVGFKGGSEPGVLQYTHLLQKAPESDLYTVSVTVNNPAKEIDLNKFNELTSRLISLIASGELK